LSGPFTADYADHADKPISGGGRLSEPPAMAPAGRAPAHAFFAQSV